MKEGIISASGADLESCGKLTNPLNKFDEMNHNRLKDDDGLSPFSGHPSEKIEEVIQGNKESFRRRSPQFEVYSQRRNVGCTNGRDTDSHEERTTTKQDGRLDLTAALRIRDIDAEMELARGINPELDSARLRQLLLDSERSSATSHFSDWDNIDSLRFRCRQLEARVQQQRQDLSSLRSEYRGICRKTEKTQEEHFKVEALLRKTIAQEEQRLSLLQKEGAQLLELEREAARQLATTLRDQQLRADRLESAIEACGQQMALALSAMVSFDVTGTTTDDDSRIEEKGDSKNLVDHCNDRNERVPFSQSSDAFYHDHTQGSTSHGRHLLSRISTHNGKISHSTNGSRPPNPRHQRPSLGLYEGFQSRVLSHNATSSKSLPPPLPPPVHDDEVSRSLAALIPETLPVLSEVLGPQSAKNLLLSPEYYRQLLHTLTTTDLSPTSAALQLVNQQPSSRTDFRDSLWTRSLADRERMPHPTQTGRRSESRSRKREFPPRLSKSTGPAVRQGSATAIATGLWERMKGMDQQMGQIAEQHRRALETTSPAELRKGLASMINYLENLQNCHHDTIKSLRYSPEYQNHMTAQNKLNKFNSRLDGKQMKGDVFYTIDPANPDVIHTAVHRKQPFHQRKGIHHQLINPAVETPQIESTICSTQGSEPHNLRSSVTPMVSESRPLPRPLLSQSEDRKFSEARLRQSDIALPYPPSFAQPTFASSISRQPAPPKSSMSRSSLVSNYSRSTSQPGITVNPSYSRKPSQHRNPLPPTVTTTMSQFDFMASPTTASQTTAVSQTSLSQPEAMRTKSSTAGCQPIGTRSEKPHLKLDAITAAQPDRTTLKNRKTIHPETSDQPLLMKVPRNSSTPMRNEETSIGLTKLRQKTFSRQRVTELLPVCCPVLSEESVIDLRASPKFIKHNKLQTQPDKPIPCNPSLTSSYRISPTNRISYERPYEWTPPDSILSLSYKLTSNVSSYRHTPVTSSHLSPLSQPLSHPVHNYSNSPSPGDVNSTLRSQSAVGRINGHSTPLLHHPSYDQQSPPRWVPYSFSGASTCIATKPSILSLKTTIPTTQSVSSSGILRQFPLSIPSTVADSLLLQRQQQLTKH